MRPFQLLAAARRAGRAVNLCRVSLGLSVLVLACISAPTAAQEIRYSWVDISYLAHDVSRQGTLLPLPDQTVDVAVSDGAGVRFRGSLGTWKNLYLMVDYGSTDIDLSGRVTNTTTGFTQDFEDEFDLTTIRGGVGFKISIFHTTDIFAEVTYDSLDLDFGSFAGENFDMDNQEFGGTLGVRTMFGDHLQLGLHGRYTNVGDADLTTGLFESDTLVGVGLAWEVIRGLAIVGEYESGELTNWSLGFRLDLDED